MIALALLLAAADAPGVAFTVPAEHRLIEGIATDGKTVWVSSVLDRTIIAHIGTRTRTIRLPPTMPNPLGLAWDPQRQWLWIAGLCPPLPGVAPCENGALFAIDRKGALKANLTPSGAFHPGDVSVGGGQVFVSDTMNGAVYRLTPEGKALVTVIPPGITKSAQGSALSSDGRSLVVVDYAAGIASVDLATGTRTLLPTADGKPLRGIDGLVRAGDWYVGIYNGASPGKAIAFRITGTTIETRAIDDGGMLPEPTQITVVGNQMLIVADAGWEASDKLTKPRTTPAKIVAIPIPQ